MKINHHPQNYADIIVTNFMNYQMCPKACADAFESNYGCIYLTLTLYHDR